MGNEPFDRLRQAREAKGYTTREAAAKAMGVPVASYIQHENGTRKLRPLVAQRYAKFFGTSPEWLLYGKQFSADPSVEDLQTMIGTALSEIVTLETRLADLPRIVAPSLHEQLERFRADRAAQRAPGAAPQQPTKRFGKGESRIQ